jgi:glycerol-3-phosphate responsive antiterminator
MEMNVDYVHLLRQNIYTIKNKGEILLQARKEIFQNLSVWEKP